MHDHLGKAKRLKNDEYYTRYEDIEKELAHYKDYFNNKIVYCNCDDYRWSEFKNYFYNNFNNLKLKKLICTCFYNLNFNLFEEAKEQKAYKYEYDGINETITELNNDGDFRSSECIELLKECDVVATNPPFSLFREYIDMLYKHDKKFIVIGYYLAIIYKTIFPLYFQNKLFVGWNEIKHFYDKELENINRLCRAWWYTNFPVKKEVPFIKLTKHYTPEEYPKYDNFDAININSYKDIPCDYYDLMGVPITTINLLNKEQFELVGLLNNFEYMDKEKGLYRGSRAMYAEYRVWSHKENIRTLHLAMLNGKSLFSRLLIKRVV